MTTNAEWLLKNGYEFSDIGVAQPYQYGEFIIYIREKCPEDSLSIVGNVNAYDKLNALEKWLDAEHDRRILDDVEKRYLAAVIRPFRDKVQSIKKFSGLYVSHCFDQILVYYEAFGRDLCFSLPPFEKGAMYKGMEIGKEYTLKELGL